MREPADDSYTAPEPPGLRGVPLEPAEAHWIEQGSGSLALLPYEAVRKSRDPRGVLLEFLESAYQAGAALAGWDLAPTSSRPGVPQHTVRQVQAASRRCLVVRGGLSSVAPVATATGAPCVLPTTDDPVAE